MPAEPTTTSARRPLGWLLAFTFAAPVLGWFSFLAMMFAAGAVVIKSALQPNSVAYGVFRRAMMPIGFYIFIMGLGQIVAGYDGPSWKAAQYLVPLLLPLLLIGVYERWALSPLQVATLARLSVAVAVLACGLEFATYSWYWGVAGYRARAFSANPLFVSVMLVPMMYLAFLDLPSASKPQRLWSVLAFVAGLLTLAISLGARGSLLIAVASLPLLYWYTRRSKLLGTRRWGWFWLLLLLVLVAGSGFVVVSQISPWFLARMTPVVNLLANFDVTQMAANDGSMYLRWVNWQTAMRAIADAPMLGHGFLNETSVLFEYLANKSHAVSSSHQQYLSFALASGIPGLMAGVGFLILPLWLILKSGRSFVHVFAALSIFLPVALNGFVDTTFDDLRILSYYVNLSLLLSVVRFGDVE